jgi:WD40 repeat protein
VRRKTPPVTFRTGQGERIDGLAFGPDGQRLWTASTRTGIVGHFDAATGQPQPVPPSAEQRYPFIASLSSGPQFSALRERTVRLWAPLTGRETTLPKAPTTMQWVTASPDGAWVAGGEEDGTVRLWRVGAGASPVVLHGHTQRVMAVAFSPDGRTLASGGYDGTVRLWHTTTGQELMTLSVPRGNVYSLAWLARGEGLISAGRDQAARGEVLRWFGTWDSD